MATGIVDIKSDIPIPPPILKLGKTSAQMRCPHCNTRVLTTVKPRFCGLISPVHECPQCHKRIDLSSKQA